MIPRKNEKDLFDEWTSMTEEQKNAICNNDCNNCIYVVQCLFEKEA